MVLKRIASASRVAAACASTAARGTAATRICREPWLTTLKASTAARMMIAAIAISRMLRMILISRRMDIPFVMAGHSRLKDGVASARLCPAIHVFLLDAIKDVDARHKAGHDEIRDKGAYFYSLKLLRLRPRDAFHDQFARVVGVAPAQHLDPFAGFEILVMFEEVLNLLQRDVGQVVVVLHLV